MCGPLKVYNNLKLGLEMLGHEVLTNHIGELTGCLHDSPLAYTLPPNTLMGPNLFLWPVDIPIYFEKFKNFAIPSDWVRPIYTTSPLYSGHNVYTWSVGINSDVFINDRSPTTDCLIYLKNRGSNEYQKVVDMLKRFNQTYTTIEYGKYTEQTYISTLKTCKYAILLTNTESQGIGYMEMLSTDLPCFVFNTTNYCGFSATSVPYFDSRCGIISDFYKDYEGDFNNFLKHLFEYHPREYIIEEHTLSIGAKRYIDLLYTCK